jgi:hypothetical protein
VDTVTYNVRRDVLYHLLAIQARQGKGTLT